MPKDLSRWAGLLLRIPVYFLLYLFFVDDLQHPELVTGAVTAVVVAIVSQFVLAARQSVRVRPAMFARLPQALLLLITDSARVTRALLRTIATGRQPRSRLRVERYRATSEEDPLDFGRRALTQWGASLGANRYVVGIDNDRALLIVHELVEVDGPLDPMRLG
jgi:multisubunit Na+/H+ antiporter MnhE subunit